jgi:chemotaxis protein methyltransferase CheR
MPFMATTHPGDLDHTLPSHSLLTPADYRFLQDYIRRLSGIALGEDKQYLLEGRLMPLVSAHGLGDLGRLCSVLRIGRDVALKQEVVEAMTTNETFFFRDAAQYEALRTTVIPGLLAARAAPRRLSVWSAATSSGQEAYSLAMLLLEMGFGPQDIQILGTDLSEQMLARARRGRYTQTEIGRGMPAAYLAKYFSRAQSEWQLRDEVRRMVRYERKDLRDVACGGALHDVIFCRNVLIYFDVETKTQILREMRAQLSPGGYLLLGNSETTLHLDVALERRVIGEAVLYQAA